MEEYLFEGMIQGKYKYIQIYSMSEEQPNHYVIHWDGVKICEMDKIDDTWQGYDEDNIDFVKEIGLFIDDYEAKLKEPKNTPSSRSSL